MLKRFRQFTNTITIYKKNYGNDVTKK